MSTKRKHIYEASMAAGAFLLITALFIFMSWLFPEYSEAAGTDRTEEERILPPNHDGPGGYPDELSAMPCCNAVNALELLNQEKPTINQEQREGIGELQTGEEEIQEGIRSQSGSDDSGAEGSDLTGEPTKDDGSNSEGDSADSERGDRSAENDAGGTQENDGNGSDDSEGAAEPVIYRIAGKLIDPEIQRKLYAALDAEGIAYWYEGALAQMMQESQGNPTVVNPENQEDMGLFQYKVRYWDWAEGDIFDADVQMRRYAREMAARFNAGLSVDECISRHNTSDSVTEVNWKYVADVKQWLGMMEAE